MEAKGPKGEAAGAVPSGGAAIVKAVDDGEVFEGLVVGVVDGVALAFVFVEVGGEVVGCGERGGHGEGSWVGVMLGA